MKETADRILQLLDDPQGLEALYRQDPEEFRESLDEASRVEPDSATLRVWRARLEFREPGRGAGWRNKLGIAIAVAVVFGALIRLPALWLAEDWYYPRFAPSLAIMALAAYFWIQRRDRWSLVAGLSLALAAIAYVRLLPEPSDSAVMALIHLPIVFWTFLGLVFMGGSWRDADSRVRFVRYNGELVVLGSLVALGGIVFSGVTIALFQLIAETAEKWYVENVAIFGAAAVPVAGTYLYDAVFNRRTGIAAALARVFSPLFLIMTVVYLIVAFVGGENPFIDRDFLITFNGLLLLVLGISVFSIVERAEVSHVQLVDRINLALVVVTLLIDAIALSAILFRIASFGFTPNRVIVLGANLVIIVHLAWICRTYVALLRRRVGFAAMRRVVGGYLPVYGVWAAVVTFALPVIFRFA
ncbi:MAG: hypothetical protein C4574_05450 [Candidatus Latescibacterota bacterium]|jgi:hypothetical protein|nr:MAG: hypothetical protein C4574_05450 [Candidatus Latescibacterota bacterium]